MPMPGMPIPIPPIAGFIPIPAMLLAFTSPADEPTVDEGAVDCGVISGAGAGTGAGVGVPFCLLDPRLDLSFVPGLPRFGRFLIEFRLRRLPPLLNLTSCTSSTMTTRKRTVIMTKETFMLSRGSKHSNARP
uniref:Uncharacterized protein n=1 Tax=Rhipicephalus zambeziensis TaxID=60191 RepID=A0A224YFN7_9ACAR